MFNPNLNNAYTDRMKCPLAGLLVDIESGTIGSLRFDCPGLGCAVWDDEKNCCSVKTIARELTRIQQKLTVLGYPKGGEN